MKTTTIKVTKHNKANVFAGAQWKTATFEEQSKVFDALAKIKKSIKQPA